MNGPRFLKVLGGGIVTGLIIFRTRTCSISDMVNKLKDNELPFNKLWNERINYISSMFNPFQKVKATSFDSSLNIKQWDWNWDGRNNTNSTDSSNKNGVKHYFFIRHGQYHYADDDDECQLTSLGREQLNYTGIRLKELNFPFTKLHYSTMTRAIESAEIVLKHLPDVPAEPNSDLREGAPYLLEPPLPQYQPTEKQLKDDGTRIERAFKTLVHRSDPLQSGDTYEIFVCHANVIRYIACRALQLSPEAWIRFSLDHGSVTWIVVRPNGCVSLRWLGNSGHMPPDKISIQ